MPAAFPMRATAYELPFRWTFRGLTERQGMLLEGPQGYGEFAPFADYDVARDAYWLAAAIEAATQPRTDELATVAVNAILPDVADGQLAAAVHDLLCDSGCQVLKVKVGGRPVADDARRVGAVVAAAVDAGTAVRLRLDGNGRLSVSDALRLAELTSDAGIAVDYLEQPVRTLAELRQLRRGRPAVPIAVDELLRADRQFGAVDEVADVAVLKVAPLGGRRAVARIAAGLSVPIVISGAAESSIAVARDCSVAAQFPDQVHGLGTATLFAEDLVAEPLLPHGGHVRADRVEVDPVRLAAAHARVNDTDRQAWAARLAAAWEFGLAAALFEPEDLAALGVSA